MSLTVVTGGNRGIGLALVLALKKRGNEVVAACRTPSPELEAAGVEIVSDVDVTKDEGVSRLKDAIGDRPIETLINNAGILVWGDTLEDPKFADMTRQFEANAVGPLRITAALKNNLPSGSKIAFITSRMGSISDNGSGGAYGYRMSKAALNSAAVSVARDLREQGVAVAVLHPGMVKTDMIGGQGQVEPEDAAAGLLARIDDLTMETSGTFWHQNGEQLPW